MARLSEHGIRLSSMSPSFLNSNSTSHTWPFSAVAELIDNASDPGVSAKQIKIDVVEEADQLCLTFTDNGSGMTPNKLHKMLSFGFTEKGSGKASQQAIGVYGNGFKSGSMRLGRDALIFTKNGGCQTVGMLSQTYLQNIKAQAVIVPIVPFNQLTKSMVVTEDSDASLAAILQNSIVNSQEQILAHFDSIVSKKGTKILIWNIRSSRDGNPEFDFDTETSDIRLPEIQIAELKKGLRNSGALRAEQNIPDLHYSLRAYLSILYLKPRTQIILRGKKILAKLVSKRLAHIEHDVYKPQFSKEKVKVTFGLNLKNKDYYGIMMYHRNRLIKAYEKVGCQLKTSGHRAGVGVIGVIECNFLKPAHNKQDFEYTKEYRLTLGALGIKLNDYWKAMSEKKAREREFQAVDRDGPEDEQDADKAPTWLQCEECLKWRSVAPGIYKEVPESWNCSQNPNARYRSCSAPEEAEDCVEVLTPSYQKNHKKQEHPKSRKRDKSLEDPTAEHQLLLRCSSEPSQPTFQSPHCPPAENAGIPAPDAHCDTAACTNDEMQTQSTVTGDGTQAQHRLAGRDTVIKEKVHMAAGDEDADGSKDTPVEPMEREIEGAGILSFKRKSGSFYVCVKKPCVRLEQLPDLGNMSAVRKPETATNTPQLLAMLEKKTTQDISSSSNRNQVEKALQRTPGSGLPWTSPLPSTQTVVVSPLSRTEGPRSRTLPTEGGDREGNMQKLAVLEKEVQRLRRFLGQEISKTTQGTMTVCDTSAEKPGTKHPASTAGREVGCQTDVVESSTSSSSESRAAALQGLGALTEKHKSKKEKKTEAQSKMKASDSEACEDSRSAQENLHDMRNNVLVLLTALLPQLDLAGISLETTDIDSILQQIIEVNSLKV